MSNLEIQEDIKLSELTTMRLGGPVRYLAEISEISQIKAAYDFARQKNIPVLIMGGGSNIIGRDEGFPGLVIINKLRGIEIISQDDSTLILKGYGGEILDDFVEYGAKLGYSGMEAMSSIPGSLGAAPVQNVGAYGQDLSQTLVSVEAFDSKTQEIVTFKKDKIGLSYRRSIFNHGPDAGLYFIISLTVKLSKTQLNPPFYASLQNYIDEHRIEDFSPMSIRNMVTAIRASKLPNPSEIASAGSFFKNIYLSDAEAEIARQKGIPVWVGNKIPSGWLLEHAGLKGKEFFGFRISDKAALILINENATSYADLARARQAISDIVFEKFGYHLEQEPVEAVS